MPKDDDIKIENHDKIMDLKLEQVEIETKQCKKCKEYKPRIRDGSYNGRDKRWRGTDGKLWNGQKCSVCHKEDVNERLRKKRNDET